MKYKKVSLEIFVDKIGMLGSVTRVLQMDYQYTLYIK